MNPDQLHEEYFKKNPSGNHDEPSSETLRFMEKQNEINEKVMESLSDIKTDLAVLVTTTKSIEAQTIRTNGRVNNLEGYVPMLDTICDERKDTKGRVKDIIWELIKMGTVAVAVLMGSSAWATHLVK
jgi:hypothetical protein